MLTPFPLVAFYISAHALLHENSSVAYVHCAIQGCKAETHGCVTVVP